MGQLEWVQQCIGDSQGPFQMTFGRHLIPQASRTVVWVGVQGIGLLGWMSFSDAVRSDAKDVVRSLQRMGIGVLLLSGDAQSAVSRIAAEVGIPQNKRWDLVKGSSVHAFVLQWRPSGVCADMLQSSTHSQSQHSPFCIYWRMVSWCQTGCCGRSLVAIPSS